MSDGESKTVVLPLQHSEPKFTPEYYSNARNRTSINHKSSKVCFGDVVVVNVKSKNEISKCIGTVCYIGYPFPGSSIRYGINLRKAKGNHNGTLHLDRKGRIAILLRKGKPRKFFTAKLNHGIFVTSDKIVKIQRKGQTDIEKRLTVGDYVDVNFRGYGIISFIGQLEHTVGDYTWYGIELDQRKGRHNGTINHIRYFDCPSQYGLHCRIAHGITLIPGTNRLKKTICSARNVLTKTKYKRGKKKKKHKTKKLEYQKSTPQRPSIILITPARQLSVLSNSITQTTVDTTYIDDLFMRGKFFDIRLPSEDLARLKVSSSIITETCSISSEPLSFNMAHHSIPDIMCKTGIPMLKNRYCSWERVLTNTQIDHRRFEDYYTYDDIYGIVGEGQFGTVFKCHKILRNFECFNIENRISISDDFYGDLSDFLDDASIDSSSSTVVNEHHLFGDVTDDDDIVIEGEYEVGEENENGDCDDVHSNIYHIDDYKVHTDDSGSVVFPGNLEHGMSNEHDVEEKTIYAVKRINKAKFHHLGHTAKSEELNKLRKEIEVMRKIQKLKKVAVGISGRGAQYLIDLYDVFEDRNYIYIVTNFCSGGNLWKCAAVVGGNDENGDITDDQIFYKAFNASDNENLSCCPWQKIMKQMLEGIHFLHKYDVAHLDLKPDNVVFAIDHVSKIARVQIIDFGLSCVIPRLTKQKMLMGSINFIAPEVVRGRYDKKADIWSLGVIFFLIRYGFPPFFCNHEQISDFADDNTEMFAKIRQGFQPIVKPGMGAWFPKYYTDEGSIDIEYNVSASFRNLIGRMLTVKIDKRLTASECLDHSYFKSMASNDELPRTVIDAFSKFNGMCKFRVMISRLFAHQIEPERQQELRKLWMQFSEDGNSITIDRFKEVMKRYQHGYEDYQIEAIFESLDYNMTDTIDFTALLTAYSFQRIVATDERLWETFALLDIDGDGQITKSEIKEVLAKLQPGKYDKGLGILSDMVVIDEHVRVEHRLSLRKSMKLDKKSVLLWKNSSWKNSSLQEYRSTKEPTHFKSPSIIINDCLLAADWDDNGTIDYEEFLRSLHPQFTEPAVTPPPLDHDEKQQFFPQQLEEQAAEYKRQRLLMKHSSVIGLAIEEEYIVPIVYENKSRNSMIVPKSENKPQTSLKPSKSHH